MSVTGVYTTMDDLCEIILKHGLGEIGEDNDGQIIIYTGLRHSPEHVKGAQCVVEEMPDETF